MDLINLPYSLPRDWLSQPKTDVQKNVVDFKAVGLPDYDGFYACILDNVLTAQECIQLTRAAESTTKGVWEKAMVNAGYGQQIMAKDVRDCGRIIWDDRDLVAKIWARIEKHVPELSEIRDQPKVAPGPARKKEVWEMTRLNERMRFLSYVEGNYFKGKLSHMYSEQQTDFKQSTVTALLPPRIMRKSLFTHYICI